MIISLFMAIEFFEFDLWLFGLGLPMLDLYEVRPPSQ